MDEDLEADPARIAAFFNELELSLDDPSDLELLVEAERRGLLDNVCALMLAEARRRALVPPCADREDEKGNFPVRYLGSLPMPEGLVRKEQTEAVREAVVVLLQNAAGATQPLCDLLVSGEGIKALADSSGDEILHWHILSSLKMCASFDKVVVTIVRAKHESRMTQMLFAYKCKDRKKAQDAVDLLNRICSRVSEDRQNPVHFSREQVPVLTVTLMRDQGGFGFNFVGPNNAADALSGVFITKIREGTPAASCTDVKEGMQILSINLVDVEEATMAECRNLLREAGSILTLRLQENPLGFAAYQARAGVSRPSVKYQGNSGTQELEHQMDKVFGDLVSLSTDMAYGAPIKMVAGKAVFQ